MSHPVAVVAIATVVIAGVSPWILLGGRIGENDAIGILAWESESSALLAEPRTRALALATLAERRPGARRADELVATRASLQRLRAVLAEVVTPRVLYPSAQALFMWLDRVIDALVVVETAELEARALTTAERGRLRDVLDDAERLYRDGRDALIRLRCRARVADCARTVLPA